MRTRQSRIYVAEAARTRVYRGDRGARRRLAASTRCEDYIQQVLSFEVRRGRARARREDGRLLHLARPRRSASRWVNAGKAARRYATFAEALERHARAWDELWEVCDVAAAPATSGSSSCCACTSRTSCRSARAHTADLDAGVPARGLNGEAYRGHIFWDELFIYPFLNFRLPEITRELLMYRYRRLGEARAAAREAGYRGAMFPWQSGSDGQEETQTSTSTRCRGKWEPDLSHNQRHVSAAIFYNIWHYYQATGDFEFLRDHGAEMMLEIARFWASIAHFNPERDRYEIHGVMGPDEFHEKYPGSDEGGLRNNAYTNVMVAWLCEIAQKVLELLPDEPPRGAARQDRPHRRGDRRRGRR